MTPWIKDLLEILISSGLAAAALITAITGYRKERREALAAKKAEEDQEPH